MFLFSCVFFSAETDSLQTLDNNHDSQQHQQQHNLFPSLDQNRYTRRGGAERGETIQETHSSIQTTLPFVLSMTGIQCNIRHFSRGI